MVVLQRKSENLTQRRVRSQPKLAKTDGQVVVVYARSFRPRDNKPHEFLRRRAAVSKARHQNQIIKWCHLLKDTGQRIVGSAMEDHGIAAGGRAAVEPVEIFWRILRDLGGNHL